MTEPTFSCPVADAYRATVRGTLADDRRADFDVVCQGDCPGADPDALLVGVVTGPLAEALRTMDDRDLRHQCEAVRDIDVARAAAASVAAVAMAHAESQWEAETLSDDEEIAWRAIAQAAALIVEGADQAEATTRARFAGQAVGELIPVEVIREVRASFAKARHKHDEKCRLAENAEPVMKKLRLHAGRVERLTSAAQEDIMRGRTISEKFIRVRDQIDAMRKEQEAEAQKLQVAITGADAEHLHWLGHANGAGERAAAKVGRAAAAVVGIE